MVKFVSSLLVASALLGVVGCGGSSSSDSANAVSNEETRSIVGSWGNDTNTVGTTCVETWAFEDNDIAADAYQIKYQVDSGDSIDIGIGAFIFDTVVTSGDRHSLEFTATDTQVETACTSSPFEDNEPGNTQNSVTLYLDFGTDDEFSVYPNATDGTSLGSFNRVIP